MADIVQEILNERFKEPTETTAETATTDTTQEETVSAETVESSTATQEESSTDGATITEVTEEAKPEPATTAVTETKPEEKQESTFDTLFQKLGVKNEDEIQARFSELQTLKESKTLGKLIDELSAKGVDPITAVTFSKLDIDKLSPADKIAWDYKMKYPSLSEEGISALITKEYGDETDAAGQAKMIIDSAKAEQSLKEQKAKVLDPTPQPKYEDVKAKESEQAEVKRVESWKSTPKVKELLTSLNKIEQKVSFSSMGEDKPVNKTFNFSYPIPKQDVENMEGTLRGIAIQQGLDPNDATSMETLRGAARNLYLIQNSDKIMASLANTVASQFHKEIALRYHNSQPQRGGVHIDTGKTSEKDKRLEATIQTL